MNAVLLKIERLLVTEKLTLEENGIVEVVVGQFQEWQFKFRSIGAPGGVVQPNQFSAALDGFISDPFFQTFDASPKTVTL